LDTRSPRIFLITPSEAASDLAPIFLGHCYTFFYLCRRGQGLSADQGPFTQDLLKQAEAKGAEARKHLHYQLITGSQLDDALAGLTFLKAAPDVDPKRITIVGHSFGGCSRRFLAITTAPFALK